jgi:hypothetical protein
LIALRQLLRQQAAGNNPHGTLLREHTLAWYFPKARLRSSIFFFLDITFRLGILMEALRHRLVKLSFAYTTEHVKVFE